MSREFGNFRGYWSAVRLDGGKILDEYRVVGDKGETLYVTSTLRSYNKVLDRWELVGMDAGNGLQDVGPGRRVGAEMHVRLFTRRCSRYLNRSTRTWSSP